MKKLLYFVVSILSLSVIFAAGWASATGKSDEPAPVNVREVTDENADDGDPAEDDCHDKKPGCPEKNLKRHVYKFKIPYFPIEDDVVFIPKKAL